MAISITQSQLYEWSLRGLIPGPQESDEEYITRATAAKKNPSSQSQSIKALYGIDPDWVEIIYSNEGLRFWEGGATWIGEDKAALHLRKAYTKKESHLGYSKKELIAHELVHMVRCRFEEPIFEEILAYQTAPSPFRRFFGPIFPTPAWSLFFIFGIAIFYVLAFLTYFAYVGMLGLILFFVLRLGLRQRTFFRARKNLAKIVKKSKVLPVMLRLSDQEIFSFSRLSPKEIVSYMGSETNLRWQQISTI